MAAVNATLSPLAQFLAHPTKWTQNTTFSSLITILSTVIVSFVLLRPRGTDKVYYLGGIPILTAWPFFTKRYDFMRERFKESGGKMFRFKILNHQVTAMSGEKLRKVFFNEPGFDMTEGYRILMGGGPEIEDVQIQTGAEGKEVHNEVVEGFIKRLLTLMRRDRISDTLPTLLSDLNVRLKELSDGERINPFRDVYDLVFQMTVRMATCQELAEDKQAIDDITKNYWAIEKSATPLSLLLPWLPSAAKRTKEKATTDVYNTILKYVQLRRNSGSDSTEPIDLLIAQGHSDPSIIATIMGIIFAGVINTGMTSCWLLLYLGANPEWKENAAKEFKSLLEKYSTTDSSEPLHKRLSVIPMEAWEDEIPTVDILIRETLRLTMGGTAIRRNIGPDTKADGVTIKHGEFLTYQLADAHFNPSIYSDPMKFDPTRYLEGREEDRKETFAYVGWGVGRHPCAGMKIAKLEIKLILALFLLQFDYKLVDKSGKTPKSLPVQDRNDIQQARPLGEPCYLEIHHVQV